MKSHVVVITGAASGLGLAIAEKFAKEHYHVIVADLDFDKANDAASKLKSIGLKATACQMNVADPESVKIGIDYILSQVGTIDILVSNAGIQIIKALDSLSFEEWKKMIAVHLDGAFLLTKACLDIMYKNNCGSIVYIGSVHSKIASLLKAPYVTAKHGLEGLCRAVAKEGAQHHVKANLVCPGFVLTPLVEKQIPEQAKALGISQEEVIKKIMLKDTVDGQFTSKEDIADVVYFLATFKTLALTGQSLIVSHGWVME